MQDDCNRETVPVERIQLGRAQLKRFCVDSSGKEVDGIPDASGLQHSVGTRQHSHRCSSCQATLHASRYRVGLERKPCAREIGRNGHTFDNTPLGCYPGLLEHNRHGFFVFVRKDFAEPADATRHSKDNPEDTYRHAGKKTCEH